MSRDPQAQGYQEQQDLQNDLEGQVEQAEHGSGANRNGEGRTGMGRGPRRRGPSL